MTKEMPLFYYSILFLVQGWGKTEGKFNYYSNRWVGKQYPTPSPTDLGIAKVIFRKEQ